MTVLIGDRFLLEDQVGAGGMGTVFRARDNHSGAPVAVKLLLAARTQPHEIMRFLREARTLAELRHPGIVSHIAHGQTPDGRPYLAMEWLEGEDLSQRLRRSPLAVPETILLLSKTAEALATAHARGIIHRDLKPSNVFLRSGELARPILLDFGIARSLVNDTIMTQSGMILGTPEYLAPEQVRCQRELGTSTDIFALGSVLYECLTGHPPFVAEHIAAVLAKILFEEAPSLRVLRPSVPPALEDLYVRMLAKEPDVRPKDAGALLAELLSVGPLSVTSAAPASGVALAPEVITTQEQRLCSVIIAASTRAELAATMTDDHLEAQDPRLALCAELSLFGAKAELLPDGSLITAVTSSTDSASDQVIQAARCALHIRDRWPEASIGLATGRGILDGRVPIGEVIVRAAQLVRVRLPPSSGSPGAESAAGVAIDALSSKLLDARFSIRLHADTQAVLLSERTQMDETRLLLGKPTPFVGREYELRTLETTFTECVDAPRSRALCIVAPPGMGKSRLRYEFLRRIKSQHSDAEVLVARGDPMTAGLSYELLGQAFRTLCGVQSSEPAAVKWQKLRARIGLHLAGTEARRVSEFLGELCNIRSSEPASAQLRAARAEPSIMSDQLGWAFVDWLRAECAHHPVLLVLEDLHWSDRPTVKLLDTALLELPDSPLILLALARPEVRSHFPDLWSGRIQEMSLAPLSQRACERFLHKVLDAPPDPQLAARIMTRSAGNALYLEELIRAFAEGNGTADELPDTVLAMLQARLQGLQQEVRRMLRAASVFGETFWRSGVVALLGLEQEDAAVAAGFRFLIQKEIIEQRRESRFASHSEYCFRHHLIRDAAYSMLTDSDRRLGHKMASEFLERIGEPSAAVIGEHAWQGGDFRRALPLLLQAAEQALRSQDSSSALLHSEHALLCGADGAALGAIRCIQVQAYLQLAEWGKAQAVEEEALRLLLPGSAKWYRAIEALVQIACFSVRQARFAELIQLLMVNVPHPDAIPEYLSALGVVLGMLSGTGQRKGAETTFELVKKWRTDCSYLDARLQGWLLTGECFFYFMLEAEPFTTLNRGLQACSLAEQTADLRSYIYAATIVGLVYRDLGNPIEGEAIIRSAIKKAMRLREGLPLYICKSYLAVMLAADENPEKREEAARLSKELIAMNNVSIVHWGWAHGALAQVELLRGDFAAAEAYAQTGCTVPVCPTMRLLSVMVLIRSLLAQGKTAAACQVADEGLSQLKELGRAGYGEVALRLAVVEAYLAAGRNAAAGEALTEAQQQVLKRGSSISDIVERERFFASVPENARTLELAQK
jgi:hypothetical protein